MSHLDMPRVNQTIAIVNIYNHSQRWSIAKIEVEPTGKLGIVVECCCVFLKLRSKSYCIFNFILMCTLNIKTYEIMCYFLVFSVTKLWCFIFFGR